MKLRPFDEDDYRAYSGVESTEPLISDDEILLKSLTDHDWDGQVIVDGKMVELNFFRCNDQDQMICQREFGLSAQAVKFVSDMPSKFDFEWLFNNYFKKIN